MTNECQGNVDVSIGKIIFCFIMKYFNGHLGYNLRTSEIIDAKQQHLDKNLFDISDFKMLRNLEKIKYEFRGINEVGIIIFNL